MVSLKIQHAELSEKFKKVIWISK